MVTYPRGLLDPKCPQCSSNHCFVCAQKGNYLVAVALAEIGTFDQTTLQQFTTQVLSKIPGGS